MKILYIADSTSVHSQRWVKHFIKPNNKTFMITLGRQLNKIPGVIHLANFNKFFYGSPSFPYVLIKTKKIISKIKPDLIHAHFVHQYGWLGALSCYSPFILTAWGTDILNLPYASRLRIGRLLTQYTLRKADHITATSEYLKKEMIKLGADSEKISIIYWGVDIKKFNPNVDQTAIRNKLKIPQEDLVILSNRNHIALYNNEIVIQAMKTILNYNPNSTLVLQNAGGPLENELKHQASKLGIDNKVRFLSKFGHSDMPQLYALADIFVSVPSWDAGPVSLKEAMACGAVPVISDVPGPMEWVRNGTNGFVVAKRNVEELSAAIIDLIVDKTKREAMSKKCIVKIQQASDHRQMMENAETIYLKAIKHKTN